MPTKPRVHRPAHAASARRHTQRQYDATAQRRADHAFYCSDVWRRARAWHLAEHPLCVVCEAEDRGPVEAKVVDHIIPRKEAPELALSAENLQSLCLSCHSRKTARGQ